MNLFHTLLYPCDKVRDFMYDYLEETLPKSVALRFHLHLNGCAACREYLYLYRTAANAGKFRRENPPPGELLDSTLDFLRREGVLGDGEPRGPESSTGPS